MQKLIYFVILFFIMVVPCANSSIFYPFSYEYKHLGFSAYKRNQADLSFGKKLWGLRYFGQNTGLGIVGYDEDVNVLAAYNYTVKGFSGTATIAIGEKTSLLSDLVLGNQLFSYGAFFKISGEDDYINYKLKKMLFNGVYILAGLNMSEDTSGPLLGFDYDNNSVAAGYSVVMSQSGNPKGSIYIDYLLNEFTFSFQTDIYDHKGFSVSLGYDLTDYIKRYESNVESQTEIESDESIKSHEDIYEPSDMDSSVVLSFPPEKTVTSKGQVLIKGMFLKNGNVYVNDEEIELAAGRFFTKYDLPKNGKNTLKIDFFDKSGNKHSLYRKVLRVKIYDDVPSTNASYKDIRHIGALGVMPDSDSDLFYPDRYVTRAELADTLVKIAGVDKEGSNPVHILDVPESYEYFSSIRKAISNRLMSGFPDNTFRPDSKVSRAEMITMLVRLAKVDVNKNYSDHGFKDVSDSHWVSRYLKAAVAKGMISRSSYFYPKAYVNRGMLVDFLKKNPIIKQKIKDLYDFKKGYHDESLFTEPVYAEEDASYIEVARKMEEQIEKEFEEFKGSDNKNEEQKIVPVEVNEAKDVVRVPKVAMVANIVAKEEVVSEAKPEELEEDDVEKAKEIVAQIGKKDKKIMNHSKTYMAIQLADIYHDIKLYSPEPIQKTVKDEILFKGKVSNADKYKIMINNDVLPVSRGGRFFKKISINDEDTTINFKINNDNFVFDVKKYHTFKDVPENHWSFKYIIKATDLGMFLKEANFRRADVVTKQELAYAMAALYSLNSDVEVKVADVLPDNKYHSAVMNVISAGMMDEDMGNFYPDKKLTRAEVINYLAKHYKGISKYNYVHYRDVFFGKTFAYDQIGFFVDKGFLSKSAYFKPDSPMTREQLAALVVRIADDVMEK